MSVTTSLDCCLHSNYFAEWSYRRHKPPFGSLILDSSSVVVTSPSIGNQSCSITAPLSPLISVDRPPIKNWPGSIKWWHRTDSARTAPVWDKGFDQDMSVFSWSRSPVRFSNFKSLRKFGRGDYKVLRTKRGSGFSNYQVIGPSQGVLGIGKLGPSSSTHEATDSPH